MCPAQALSPLIEHFQSLDDPRCSYLVEHRLLDIIGLTLCAVICHHWLLEGVEHLIDAERWVGLKRVGLVESERRILGHPPTIEQRYYLVSFDGGVQRFAQGVRCHWGIENQLHWVFDVAFQEDASRIRKDHAPANLAVVRHIALNLLRQDSSAKGGVKAKRLQAGWDNDYLLRLLSA